MTRLITFIVVIALVNYVFYWLRSKNPNYKGIKREDFPDFIDNLMIRFVGDGFLSITHEATGKFIQLMKYVNANCATIFFCFPVAIWSENYARSFKEQLKVEGIEYTVKDPPSEEGKSILNAYCIVPNISSIELAQKITLLAIRAMEIPPNDLFTLKFRPGVEKDVLFKIRLGAKRFLKRQLTRRSS